LNETVFFIPLVATSLSFQPSSGQRYTFSLRQSDTFMEFSTLTMHHVL